VCSKLTVLRPTINLYLLVTVVMRSKSALMLTLDTMIVKTY